MSAQDTTDIEGRTVLTFRGCKSLREAQDRLDAFLEEESVVWCRRVGAEMILHDAAPEDISAELAGLRVELAAKRERCRTWLAELFTADGRLR